MKKYVAPMFYIGDDGYLHWDKEKGEELYPFQILERKNETMKGEQQMDKQWQDIHIIYGEEYQLSKPAISYTIRQVNIKSVTTNDLFIKINVVDAKDNKNIIVVPKLNGVKVVFD